MKRLLTWAAGASVAALLLFWAPDALAQPTNNVIVLCKDPTTGVWNPCSAANPLPVTSETGGSVTAVQGNAGTNAQAWWVRIGDATNGPVAVKPASTAAIATDPALVTTPSPNGTQAVSGTVTATGSVANSNDVAQASASSGQVGPLVMGAAVGATNPTLATTQTYPLSLDLAGRLRVVLSGAATTANIASPSIGSDAQAATAGLPTNSQGVVWNGTTTDRVRGNIDVAASLVALSAAGAGTVNSSDQTNYNGRCLTAVVDITVAGGTPTLTVTIQGKDIASGKYYTLLASTALGSVATTPLVVCPGTTVSANLDVAAPLPRTWRVSAVVGGVTPAVTATIGASVTN